MLHIYCGDGKGKTTAALGLAIRAAGAGLRVHIVQLMKGAPTSELTLLARIPEISIARCDRDYGFSWKMSDRDKSEITACHNRLLSEAFAIGADMVILDEFNSAYANNLLDRKVVERLIGEAKAEIVLTGRNPDPKFLEKADYISEIQCVRHPYEQGVTARKGIEF